MWGVLLSLIAASPTVSVVATSSTTEAIRSRVAREVGEVAWRDEGADLALVVLPEGASWRLEIVEGTSVLERRTIDATDRDAATRVAALLLVDAMDRWTPPPEPPEPPTPKRLRASAALEGVAWGSPFTPMPGVSVAMSFDLGGIRIGARAGWRRWCCGVASESIEADPHTLSLIAEVDVGLFRLGELQVGLAGGIGVAHDRVEAVAIFPGGRGPPEQTTDWQLAGRATGWVGFALSRVDLRLAAGAWIQGGTLAVELPEFFDAVEPLRRGVVSPYLALETGVRF